EPLADKQAPRNGYAGKFSTPYCIAYGFLHRGLGLEAFTDAAVAEPQVRALAAKVRYVIDPENPYPRAFTGHVRATLRDGTVVEERQPHFRGGAREPLTRADIEEKFALCCRHGGWDEARIARALTLAHGLYDGAVELSALRG
ncbi:MAG: MmgE/PrpD family protein, partial [Variibacter sp.]|nr:MmgE/PrpD family protein [Variibacter sp.]